MAFGSLGGLLGRQVPSLGSNPGKAGGSAVIAGLTTLALGYAGYRFGRYCTREICADGDKPIAQRRNELRWFAVGVAAAYFVLFAALGSMLPRR